MVLKQAYLDLVHNSAVFARLQAESGFFGHAYFLDSADEIALHALALLIGLSVACKQDNKPCLGCDACLRGLRGVSPDIKIFDKEKFLVESANEITRDLLVTPLVLDKKIYIIHNAHTMTPPAQNKLLKALEEPPSSAMFILCGIAAGGVLPTILSRCRVVSVAPFATDSIHDALVREYGDLPECANAAAASGGLIGNADAFMLDENANALFEMAYEVLLRVTSSKIVPKYTAKLLARKAQLPRFIDYMTLILRDALIYRQNCAAFILSKSNLHDIIGIAKLYNDTVILNLIKLFSIAKKRLATNANPSAVIDDILLSLPKERYKCRPL